MLLSAGTRARYPTLLATGAKSRHEGDMTPLAGEHGVELAHIPGLGRELRLAGDLRALWSLWRLCRRHKPDVVHTHTAKAGTLGRLAAWLAGVPVRVHTFHGHVFSGNFPRWQAAIYVAIERLLARITTRIVAISPRQAKELSRYLRVPEDRITIVPLGFDLGRFVNGNQAAARQRFRAAVAASDSDVVIAMVARLTAVKNHALALRAFAALDPAERNGSLLVLVGGGEEEPRLRALAAELGIDARVRFAGWWHDLEAVYYGSDIVALSSANEGTPVCLIEALVCGRAVLATDVGGVADVLEDGRFGVLVPPGEVGAFTAALRRLLDRDERERYAGAGRSAALARYDVRRLVSDVESLYDDLLLPASRRNSSSTSSAQTA